MKSKNLALICPNFFEYNLVISNALKAKGRDVYLFDERPSNDFLSKVLIRLGLRFLIKKKIHQHYQRIAAEIINNNIDEVLIISPETAPLDFFKKIKEIKGLKIYMYLWDSIVNKPYSKVLLQFADKCFSFDYDDSQRYERLNFLPLFFSKDTTYEGAEVSYMVGFIGTIHSQRYKAIKQIKDYCSSKGYNSYIYLYCPSRILFFFKKYVTLEFRNVDKKDISFNQLSLQTMRNNLKMCNIILDFSHENQSGLTMRTFEAIGSKKKLITDNKSIENYDFFNESNVMVLKESANIMNDNFFSDKFDEGISENFDKYNINNWLENILDEKK